MAKTPKTKASGAAKPPSRHKTPQETRETTRAAALDADAPDTQRKPTRQKAATPTAKPKKATSTKRGPTTMSAKRAKAPTPAAPAKQADKANTAAKPAAPAAKPRTDGSLPVTTARAPRRTRQGLPDPGFTSPYRRRLYQLHEWLWRGDGAGYERLPTQGVVSLDELTLPKTRLVEAYPDRPSPAQLVDWTVDALPMRAERLAFIDLGSGRGRVLMEAAKHPFQEVIGVEVTRELHETALMNLRHWPRWRLACRNVTLVNSDVGQFDMPRRNIVLYLFRPFTERLMMAVARKATAVARTGHEVFVIVVDPKHATPFDESPIFDRMTPSSSVRRRLRWRSPYSVAFYRANLP